MSLNTAELFLITIHRPDKPGIMITETAKNAGLAGALLLDLAQARAIEIKDGRLIPLEVKSSLSPAHEIVLSKIRSSAKQRKIKHWISRFAQIGRKLQKEILRDLRNRGMVKLEQRRFLFIPYFTSKLLDRQIRDRIVENIRNGLLFDKDIDPDYALLPGFIEPCRMHRIFCRNREEIKRCKKRVKELMASNLITEGVDTVIREMQAAITGALVATGVATTAGAH